MNEQYKINYNWTQSNIRLSWNGGQCHVRVFHLLYFHLGLSVDFRPGVLGRVELDLPAFLDDTRTVHQSAGAHVGVKFPVVDAQFFDYLVSACFHRVSVRV